LKELNKVITGFACADYSLGIRCNRLE